MARSLRLIIVLILFVSPFSHKAQEVHNDILGYSEAETDSTLFDLLEFDGSGRVNIMGLLNNEFFRLDDMLIPQT